MPNDYLGLSLFTLLCCFFPIGICALMQSMQVVLPTCFGAILIAFVVFINSIKSKSVSDDRFWFLTSSLVFVSGA